MQISLTPALVNGQLQENVGKKLLWLPVNSGKMRLVCYYGQYGIQWLNKVN